MACFAFAQLLVSPLENSSNAIAIPAFASLRNFDFVGFFSTLGDIPSFVMANELTWSDFAALPFLIHGANLIPSAVLKTEKTFDLTFVVTFTAMLFLSQGLPERAASLQLTERQSIVFIATLLWVLRVGVFLIIRMLKNGSDSRHDEIKTSVLFNMFAHCVQAAWIVILGAPVFILLQSDPKVWTTPSFIPCFSYLWPL